MPSVGFEPTISASERPQTYALDRAATGILVQNKNMPNIKFQNPKVCRHLPLLEEVCVVWD